MKLIERVPASHWYLPDGRPFYEIGRKDGSGNRPVTLADARKVFALPSVTNVLGVLAKPGLDAWRVEQGIIAALTLPRLPDESLDVFARRVVVDMGQQGERAADFGPIAPFGGVERTLEDLFGADAADFLKASDGRATTIATCPGVTLASIHILRARDGSSFSIEHSRPSHTYLLNGVGKL